MLAHNSLRHLTLAVQLLIGVALLSVSWLSDEVSSADSVVKANHQSIESINTLKSKPGKC